MHFPDFSSPDRLSTRRTEPSSPLLSSPTKPSMTQRPLSTPESPTICSFSVTLPVNLEELPATKLLKRYKTLKASKTISINSKGQIDACLEELYKKLQNRFIPTGINKKELDIIDPQDGPQLVLTFGERTWYLNKIIMFREFGAYCPLLEPARWHFPGIEETNYERALDCFIPYCYGNCLPSPSRLDAETAFPIYIWLDRSKTNLTLLNNYYNKFKTEFLKFNHIRLLALSACYEHNEIFEELNKRSLGFCFLNLDTTNDILTSPRAFLQLSFSFTQAAKDALQHCIAHQVLTHLSFEPPSPTTIPPVGSKHSAEEPDSEAPPAKRRKNNFGKAEAVDHRQSPLCDVISQISHITHLDFSNWREELSDEELEALTNCPSVTTFTLPIELVKEKMLSGNKPLIKLFHSVERIIILRVTSNHSLTNEEVLLLKTFLSEHSLAKIILKLENQNNEVFEVFETICHNFLIPQIDVTHYAIAPSDCNHDVLRNYMLLLNASFENQSMKTSFNKKAFLSFFVANPSLINEYPHLVMKLFPEDSTTNSKNDLVELISLFKECEKDWNRFIINYDSFAHLMTLLDNNEDYPEVVLELYHRILEIVDIGEPDDELIEKLNDSIRSRLSNPYYSSFFTQYFKWLFDNDVDLERSYLWIRVISEQYRVMDPAVLIDYIKLLNKSIEGFKYNLCQNRLGNTGCVVLDFIYKMWLYSGCEEISKPFPEASSEIAQLYCQIVRTSSKANQEMRALVVHHIAKPPIDLPEDHFFLNRYKNDMFIDFVLQVLGEIIEHQDYLNNDTSVEIYTIIRALIEYETVTPLENLRKHIQLTRFILTQASKASEKRTIQKNPDYFKNELRALFSRDSSSDEEWQKILFGFIKNLGPHLKNLKISPENRHLLLLIFHHFLKFPELIKINKALAFLTFETALKELENDEKYKHDCTKYFEHLNKTYDCLLDFSDVKKCPGLLDVILVDRSEGVLNENDIFLEAISDPTVTFTDDKLDTLIAALDRTPSSEFSKIAASGHGPLFRRLLYLWNNLLDRSRGYQLLYPTAAKIIYLTFDRVDAEEELDEGKIAEVNRMAAKLVCSLIEHGHQLPVRDLPNHYEFAISLLDTLAKHDFSKHVAERLAPVLEVLAPYFQPTSEASTLPTLNPEQQALFRTLFVKFTQYPDSLSNLLNRSISHFSSTSPEPQKFIHAQIVATIAKAIFSFSLVPQAYSLAERLVTYPIPEEDQRNCLTIMKYFNQVPNFSSVHDNNQLLLTGLATNDSINR